MAKSRKMVNLSVEETSGVDHPAHLHEGWIILKHADEAGVAEVIENLAGTSEEETTMSEETTDVNVAELQDALAKANERIAELETAIAAATISEPVEEPQTEEALIKSMPEPVREMLEKARQAEVSAREELAKAREIARDKEFTEKVAMWKSLSLDAEEFGPMLRRLSDVDASLAEQIEKMLQSVDAQAESANLFAELGSTKSPQSSDAYGRVESLAKARVASGENKTMEQAVAAVIAANPDLYNEYLAEKRG